MIVVGKYIYHNSNIIILELKWVAYGESIYVACQPIYS